MRRRVAIAAALAFLPVLAAGQQVEYYHLDALGSVRAVTDATGDVITRHDYEPFGEEWEGEPSADTRRFTGKERDSESGMDYFGARYYWGPIARFTSVDPVYTWNENLADPERWNRYAYVRNNPLRYVDPDGRAIETPWDVLNVGIGVGSLTANVVAGNVGGAIVDAVGIVYDVAATATPFLPGGASTAIRAARGADKIADIVRTTNTAGDALTAADKATDLANQAEGIVYLRTNAKTGTEYVGRTKSDATFLNRQRSHNQKLGTKHEYEILDRATPGTSLRVSEESAIRTRGGPGNLANKRYEMNDAAYKACGGTCQKPK